MKISDILKLANILINVPSLVPESLTGTGKSRVKNKIEVIHDLIDFLVETHDLTERQKEAVDEAVIYRERQKSTGMEREVAIPAGKTSQVQGLIAVLSIYPDGIDFDSIDKIPAKFIFLAVSDYEWSTEHVQVRASLMRILQKKEISEWILKAESPQEVWAIIDRECKELERL